MAGAIVGHLGNYIRRGDTDHNRPLTHLELLAGREFPAFIAQCRALAKGARKDNRTVLKIDVGAKLIKPTRSEELTNMAGQHVTLAKDSPRL